MINKLDDEGKLVILDGISSYKGTLFDIPDIQTI